MNVPDVLEQDWLVAMVDSVVIDAIEVVRMEPMLLSVSFIDHYNNFVRF